MLQAAEEGLNKAGTEATTERDFDAFKTQSESLQSWIREQKQKLVSLSSNMPFEERLQVAQVSVYVFRKFKLVTLLLLLFAHHV